MTDCWPIAARSRPPLCRARYEAALPGRLRARRRTTAPLASSLLAGELDLAALARLDDRPGPRQLVRLKASAVTAESTCSWAARPDSWPAGDRALAVPAQQVMGLADCAHFDELEALAAGWRPWRP